MGTTHSQPATFAALTARYATIRFPIMVFEFPGDNAPARGVPIENRQNEWILRISDEVTPDVEEQLQQAFKNRYRPRKILLDLTGMKEHDGDAPLEVYKYVWWCTLDKTDHIRDVRVRILDDYRLRTSMLRLNALFQGRMDILIECVTIQILSPSCWKNL
jgi:hypothetical protein